MQTGGGVSGICSVVRRDFLFCNAYAAYFATLIRSL